MIADAGLPLNLSHFAEGRLPGASRRGAVLPEAARGEPDDVGVYRDLDDGVGGAVVCPARAAAEHPGEGPGPGAGGELVQPLPLARDPGAAAQGLVNGGVAWLMAASTSCQGWSCS